MTRRMAELIFRLRVRPRRTPFPRVLKLLTLRPANRRLLGVRTPIRLRRFKPWPCPLTKWTVISVRPGSVMTTRCWENAPQCNRFGQRKTNRIAEA
jgi:hypothetical protein